MTKHFDPLAATKGEVGALNMVHSASVDEDPNFAANSHYLLTPTNHMFTSQPLVQGLSNCWSPSDCFKLVRGTRGVVPPKGKGNLEVIP